MCSKTAWKFITKKIPGNIENVSVITWNQNVIFYLQDCFVSMIKWTHKGIRYFKIIVTL